MVVLENLPHDPPGRGVSVDVVEASARAYLAAINRALQVTTVREGDPQAEVSG